MASVKIDSVFKYYYSGNELIKAVADLNLVINNGEIVSILGPSGCGKSSTMRMIAGLEPITVGDIYIDNQRVNDLDPSDRNVALAFESYALYQHLTVRENISFCLKVQRCNGDEINRRVARISELLGIVDFLDSKPVGLSGGQQQLVSLARALIRQPSVTLLDEPISHLDTRTRLNISLKIRQIHRETGLTMIYVTHNQEEALALGDKIAVMNLGELQQVGERVEILNRPYNTFVADFIGEPSMNFIECRVKNENGMRAVNEDKSFSIAIDKRVAAHITKDRLDRVIVGIRPIDLYEKRKKNIAGRISGKVNYFEFLGETAIVKLSIGKDTTILAVVNPSLRFRRDELVSLFYDHDNIHLFNPETKLRIQESEQG
jgi:multiple sugar transport system ATP-binding protein